jgi:hypothetical protein
MADIARALAIFNENVGSEDAKSVKMVFSFRPKQVL